MPADFGQRVFFTPFFNKIKGKRVKRINNERYSDFASLIARYEKEMREAYGKTPLPAEIPPEEEPKEPLPPTEIPVFGEVSAEMPADPPHSERPFPEEPPTEDNEELPQDDTGEIMVTANAGRGAVPLSGVSVLIDRNDPDDEVRRQELVGLLETDASGKTENIRVKTVSRLLSLVPGNKGPFATYYVSTRLAGYEPVDHLPVDVFGGQVSLLKVEMIPLAEDLGRR